ncbi:MAG TPA: EamA family transporter, partial [Actinomycetes bacterium]|nr:EamA family transporter [Actinomycetes bacterium]
MTARAWVLFAAVSVVWGVPYFFIKVAVGEVHPTVIVFTRTLLAAVVMLPLAARRGALVPVLRRWKAVLALTALEIIAPFLLITYGEQWVSSSPAGLLIAPLPLVVALLA